MNRDRWQEIKRIYNSALEIESDRREQFVRQACAGDAEMQEQVGSLLARHVKAEAFFEEPAVQMAASAVADQQRSFVGCTVLHYRVIRKIGQGGMGEVFLADDVSLGRKVAIKVLPQEFSGDFERLARFEREAKLLASLSHPNIATIHGLEQSGEQRFIVMELVEGKTLAERLSKGALPLEETLRICRQIAEGLEAAHEKGIIHRDLKPANVMIAPDGKLKILDFGLAKVFSAASTAADATRSPTITEEMNGPGVVLGTAAYMSPEQAEGTPVDKRTDIWAFGCILYECLAGKRAFEAQTVTETLAAVLKSDPDWQALPDNTPISIRQLLRWCLQRDLGRRLHDIADARIETGELAFQPSEAVALPRRLPARWLVASVGVALLVGALIAVTLMRYFRPAASPVVSKTIVRIEPGQWLAGMARQSEFWRPSRTSMAISSDGRFIVYSAIEGDPSPQAVPKLYIRRMDQMEAKSIAGTEGGISPFLSPDDRWVGFWAGGKLAKVPVEGGVPAILCDVSLLFGASWGPDNNIVFSPNFDAGLFRVSADGGKPEALTAPDNTKGEIAHRLPHCLPDGKGVLFTIMREVWDARPSVAVLDLKARNCRVLLEDAADARYISTGHLVFLRSGTLMGVPFDISRLDVTGQPVPVFANIMQAINSTHRNYNTCAGQFSISDSGWLICITGGFVPDMENSLVWVDQRGTAQPIASFKAPFIWPRLSPDGQEIAYATIGSEWRVHVYDLNRGTVSPLDGEGKSNCVTWTTDGKRVIFHWWKSGQPPNLFWQTADGSTRMERLATSEYGQSPGPLTPDGATLAIVGWPLSDTLNDILLLDMKSRRVTPFLNSRFNERYPAFSPDGRWLTYSSDESGREEVYVRSFPDGGGKWKLSLQGGTEPLWARNGKQLFYRWQDQVWAVDVRMDTGFTPSRPRLLFEKPGYRMSDPVGCWDISPDGQRFLMVKLDDRKPTPVTEMILVQNWFEELKRLVPAGNK